MKAIEKNEDENQNLKILIANDETFQLKMMELQFQ
jgi:hypothetical protein